MHCVYRIEKDSRCFSYIFEYLDDKGLQKELWGKLNYLLVRQYIYIYIYILLLNYNYFMSFLVAMEAIAVKLFDKLLGILNEKVCMYTHALSIVYVIFH